MADKDPIAKYDDQLKSYLADLIAQRTVKVEELRALDSLIKRAQKKLAAGSDKATGNGKPSPTQAEIVKTAEDILRSGPQSEESLKDRIAERLRPERSLIGWAHALKQALAMPQFTKEATGVRLTGNAQAASKPQLKPTPTN